MSTLMGTGSSKEAALALYMVTMTDLLTQWLKFNGT
jgi:hypothetical protein